MSRLTVLLATLLVLSTSPASAQANAAGEWAVSFATPVGSMEFTMIVAQNGGKLSGHLTSDIGEFPMTGTVEGDQVTIVWTLMDEGKPMEITFRGTVDRNSITGTAQLGKVGKGPMSAERIGAGE
jgi:hypothetical protein